MYDFETLAPRVGCGSMKWDLAKAAGCPDDITPLTVADMEFKVAPEILEAIHAACDAGLLGYTWAHDGYRQAVSAWMEARHGWAPKPGWMVNTTGIVPAIYAAVRAFTQPGDGVLLQPPVYTPFFSAIKQNERRVVENRLHTGPDGRFEIDFDNLRRQAKKARLMLLCNPHNPGGRAWTPAEVQKIAEICTENHVVLFVDEIHCDILLNGTTHAPAGCLPAELLAGCLIGTSTGKTFNLAGVPCSVITIPDKKLRAAFSKQTERDGYGFNTALGLAASEAAYRHGGPWLDALLPVLQGNAAWLRSALATRLPMLKMLEPDATYLAWIDCAGLGLERQARTDFLQDEGRLFVNDGESFGSGGAGFIRLNFACPRFVLQDAVDRLQAACRRRSFI